MRDLVRLAEVPAADDDPLNVRLQKALAQAVLAWEGTRRGVSRSDPATLAAWLAATVALDQLLAGLRPALRRRAVRHVRAALAPLRKRLSKAARARAVLAGCQAVWDRAAEPDHQLADLVESALLAAQAAAGAAASQARASQAADTSKLLHAFVLALPVKRRLEGETLSQGAPIIIEQAARHLIQRQAAFLASEPASWRSAAQAIERLKVTAVALKPAAAPGELAPLLQDLDQAGLRLADLRRLADMERLVAARLDVWAERQARRKAPQLHGAETLLEVLSGLRADRARYSRMVQAAWRPVRGRALQRRVKSLWLPPQG